MGKLLKVAVLLSAVDKMSSIVGKAVDKSTARLKKFADDANKFGKSAFSFAQGAGAVGLGIMGGLALPVKAAADMEKMNVALRTAFQGNQQAATEAFKTIQTFAAKTPYEMGEVMQSFVKLKNMGLDPSMEALSAYGNTASAMGKSLNDMIEAVADAATGEFERLKEFGIRSKSVGDSVYFTFQGTTTKVAKNAASIETYLKKIGQTKFAGGMEAQSKTFYGQLSTLKDNITMVGASIGETLLPILNQLFARIGPVIDRVMAWVKANPELTQQIGVVAGVVGSLALGLSGIGFVVGGVATGIGKLATAFKAVSSAVSVVSKVMMANPWILAIMAIAAAAYLIIKNWDKIKAWFIRLWDNIKKIFLSAWEWLKGLFLKYHPIGLVITHWDKIKAFFANLWNTVKGHFIAVWDWIKNMFLNYTPQGLVIKHWDKIKDFFVNLWARVKSIFLDHVNFVLGLGAKFIEAGKNIVNSIWQGMKAMAHKPVEAIKDIAKKIRDFLPFSPAKEGALRDIHRVKIVETIAESMKPTPAIKAMRRVTSQIGASIGISGGAGSPSPMFAGAGASTGGGGVTINFSPTFNGGDKASIMNELKGYASQLVDMIEREQERRRRKSF